MKKGGDIFLRREKRGINLFFSSFDVKIKFLSIKKGHEFFCSKDKEGKNER